MGKLFGRPLLAFEAIDFQTNSSFGKELENVIEAMRLMEDAAGKDYQNSQEKRILEAIIRKHTGLTVAINFENEIFGMVSVNVFQRSSIFIDHVSQAVADETGGEMGFLKVIDKFKLVNTVDLHTGMVTGVFAVVLIPIMLSWKLIKNKTYSVSEIVAILMHELGHCFVMFEYSSRIVSTNQVLAGMSRLALDTMEVSKKEFLFKSCGELLMKDQHAFDGLEKLTDEKAIYTVVADGAIKKAQSELKYGGYDSTSNEQLADQYAVRQGYGRAFITAHEKLMRDEVTIFDTFQLTGILGLSALLGGLLVGTTIVSVFGLIMFINSFSMTYALKSMDKGNYDTVKVRYKRIREQVITDLKNKKLPKDLVVEKLKDLEVIDEYIGSVFQSQGYVANLVDYMLSPNRKERSYIALQRQLEELASNDLFISSQKLRAI